MPLDLRDVLHDARRHHAGRRHAANSGRPVHYFEGRRHGVDGAPGGIGEGSVGHGVLCEMEFHSSALVEVGI